MINIFAIILLSAMAASKLIYQKFPAIHIWKGYSIRIVILIYIALAIISFLVLAVGEDVAAGLAVNIVGIFGWWLPTILPKVWKWFIKTCRKKQNARMIALVVIVLIAINIPMATSYIVAGAIVLFLLGYMKKKITKKRK